jgi:hypothetical protein
MNDSVKNRLIAFIKSQGISVNRFEKICGFSTGYVGNMRKSIQPDKVMSIIQNFPTLILHGFLQEKEKCKKN